MPFRKENRSFTLDELENLEWLETTATGGWASQSLGACATRRYHGMLIAAAMPPVQRRLVISTLGEKIIGENVEFELSSLQYPGTRHPHGYQYLTACEIDPLVTQTYEGPEFKIIRSTAGIHGENTVLVEYQIVKVPPNARMSFNPLCANRPIHELARASSDRIQETCFKNGRLELKQKGALLAASLYIPESQFHANENWYVNVRYAEEERRGYDFEEDLLSYGTFERPIQSGDRFVIELSTAGKHGRDLTLLLGKEKSRRARLVEQSLLQSKESAALVRAADQFIVQRGGGGSRSIIAGYHWFADWGRDAMIALPGLCLVTGRFEDAKHILLTFAESMSGGLIPNNFSDDGGAAGYNTIDATLWFFVALYQYVKYTNDTGFIAHLLPILHESIEQHVKGTYHGIHLAEDGLLSGGNPTTQLTWMDAKIGDWVVTARQGKAVEVNALWFNALSIMAVFCTRIGLGAEAARYAARARVAKERFNQIFWNGEQECLFDYIDGSFRDTRIRPNQIFALSLPFPIIEGARAISVLRVLEQRLLTPFGLRTLDPAHPSYQPQYSGAQSIRDSAYHQGTVWPWLLGPYISALCRVHGTAAQPQARNLLAPLLNHFSQRLCAIPEIFDAAAPHHPRGAISQAWSLAELLRCLHEDFSH
jgi:predicted glycogen debranching enzyme